MGHLLHRPAPVRSPRGRGTGLLALLLSLSLTSWAAAESIQVLCGEVTPQSRAVIQGLERVLQRSLPIANAGGDTRQLLQLSRNLAQERPTLLIVLGTPALMAVAPRIKNLPTVFAMVADPFQTGAAYDASRPEDHQDNITGIASPPPLEQAIHQTLSIFPRKKRWGMIYHPHQGASVELRQLLTRLAVENHLSLTTKPALTAPEAEAALKDLVREGVEVLFLPPDHFAPVYGPAALALGQQRLLVVVNGNPRLTGKGAVLRVTLDYNAVGEAAGRLVQRLQAGEKPKQIPITRFSPATVEVDEALLQQWAGYPRSMNKEGQ